MNLLGYIEQNISPRQIAQIGVFATLLSAVSTSHSAGWQVEPNVGLGLVYTDNVELAPRNEEEDFITELNAGVEATRTGGRLEAAVNYNLQGLAYQEDSDRNNYYHQLDAFTSLEAVRDNLFLDAEAVISQEIVDHRRNSINNNVSQNDNRTSIYTVALGPRLRHQFGDALVLSANLQTSVVGVFDSDSNANTDNVDSTQNSGAFSLGNVTDGKSLQWILEYSQSVAEDDSNNETREEKISLSLLYPVSRTTTLIAVAGEEENEFEQAAGVEEPEDSFWEVGVQWQAGPRDQIELRGGERFFGNTYTLLWDHRGKRFTSNVSYNEDITTTTEELLNDDDSDITRFSSETSISKQLDVSIGIVLPKSEIEVSLFATSNEFQVSQVEDRSQGGSVSWDWRVGARSNLLSTIALRRTEFGDTDEVVRGGDFDTVFTRQFSPTTSASAGYSYSQFKSDDESDEYTEHRLTIGVNRTF